VIEGSLHIDGDDWTRALDVEDAVLRKRQPSGKWVTEDQLVRDRGATRRRRASTNNGSRPIERVLTFDRSW
jgi:hypothetical protein